MDRQRNRNTHSAGTRFKWREIKAEILASGLNRNEKKVAVKNYMVYKLALRRGFSEYFGFPCQFSFHQLLHTH
jgi:hypothetical protein